ncbi:unnamed protein product [Calypogeia fissa]
MRAHTSSYAPQGYYNSTGSSSGRYGDPAAMVNSGYAQQPAYAGYGEQQQPPPRYGEYGGQPFGQPPQATYTAAGSNSGRFNSNRPVRYGQGVGRIRVWFPPGTDPEAIRAFEAGDYDGSGFIDANELSRVVSASVYIPFSTRTVNLMLHLFSANGTDKIGPTEFVALWKELKDWRGVFEIYDRDRSGTIDQGELRDAFIHMGYAISTPLLQILISKYDRTGQNNALDYDNFIECGLVVKGLTDRFKVEDKNLTGSATLKFEKFMQIVLPFIVANTY